ncbi:MAG: MFS transporter [Chloroflexi bacterium]|nr:MAG: MFS transporter [Chloroflexota bacterium]
MTEPQAIRRGRRLPRGLAAFRHRNYRLFWFGQLISVTGTWMQTLAQSWLVLTLTASAFKLGLVTVFQFTPILLIGLFAGVVADRMPKRRLLVFTQATACTLAGLLTFLVASDRVQLWHVYALAFGLGVVNAFDMPTRQAFVVEMVGKDDLMNAIALNSSLFNAARIVGPALAGGLLAAFGPAICFGLNTVSYLAVIAGLLLMRIEARPVAAAGRGLAQVREGLAYVRSTPDVLYPIIMVGLVATFGMNFNIWVPVLANQTLGVGASGFGMLMSAMGAGSLLGALALAFLAGQGSRAKLLYGAAGLMGLLELALALAGALSLPLVVALLCLVAIGFASTSTMSSANTTVQTNAPDALRGRVMSVYMTVFAGTAPFGGLVAGATARAFGAPVSIAIGAIVTLLAVGGTVMRSGLRVQIRRSASRKAT